MVGKYKGRTRLSAEKTKGTTNSRTKVAEMHVDASLPTNFSFGCNWHFEEVRPAREHAKNEFLWTNNTIWRSSDRYRSIVFILSGRGKSLRGYWVVMTKSYRPGLASGSPVTPSHVAHHSLLASTSGRNSLELKRVDGTTNLWHRY